MRDVEDFPFIAVTCLASGIHPSTSRLITLDAVTFNLDGEVGEEFHAVINPGQDPGPKHMHGLSHEDVKQGRRFSNILRKLDALIDDRTLVVHNAARSWGFITFEARRAMNAAARANRSNKRNRGQQPRRRRRVGHVPRPVEIVDTLATARRQAKTLSDTRLAGVAGVYGMDVESPVASVHRANRDPKDIVREHTILVKDLFLIQGEPRASREPGDLKADRFGLQRSRIRVDATKMDTADNPGVFRTKLHDGMEVAIAPEIQKDPNMIIQAIVDAGCKYSEKVTRETSLVVCNQRSDLTGKAMHAERKNIPLVTDDEFLELSARKME